MRGGKAVYPTNFQSDEVIEKYSDMVYRLAFSMMKKRSDADDIYQEVFLRYIKKAPEFQSEEHRKAWLIKVTVNCCKKAFSSAWFRHTTSFFLGKDDDDNEQDMNNCLADESMPVDEQTEQKTDIHNAVQKLPQKYRAVIHLFYFEDMTTAEISKILDIKESTVRTQLTRAREMLKEYLKGGYQYE